jgi:hypothetical protein
VTDQVKDRQRKLLAVIQGLTLRRRRPVATTEILRHLTSVRQDYCDGLDPVYDTTDEQDGILSTLVETDLSELHSGGLVEVFEGTVQCTRLQT